MLYKYMRDNTADDWGIKKLQECILEIAVYVADLCDENGIEYCLMGGSALGAIRHNGFIPWDDDLDLFMTPDNYEKFVSVFEEKGDKDRFQLEPFGKFGKMVTLGKVRMKGTTYVEESLLDYQISHQVYLDIFILHVCPNNVIKRRWQYIWAKYLVAKGQAYRDTSRYGLTMRIALGILRCFPRMFLTEYALKQVYRFRNESSDWYCNYLGKARYQQGTYKKSWFESYQRVPFEKVTMMVPIGVEAFLKERFGDYMQIPNLEKIRREQHASIWDTEADYTQYVNQKPKYPSKYVW